MKKKNNLGLLLRIILGILAGIAIGFLGNEVLIRIFATFSSIFGNLLKFTVPLLILAFITNGIAQLGGNSGKILFATVMLAYVSSILAGFLAFFVNSSVFPYILSNMSIGILDSRSSLSAYFTIDMPPVFSVTSSLVLAFILGVGLSKMNDSSALKKTTYDFFVIIENFITKVIIPLLPVHIIGIFATMTQSGQLFTIMGTFGKVFLLVIGLHFTALIIQYAVAGIYAKKNPLECIKNMLPAYFAALGTQSSAATIPITVQQMKQNGIRSNIAEFTAPLCANIHLSGSAITLTTCAMAILKLQGTEIPFSAMAGFIMMLGLMVVAAPGIPGGAVMASLGILESILGFSPEMLSLMIALYIAQDSFGTALNVTGDGAIALIIDRHDQQLAVSK